MGYAVQVGLSHVRCRLAPQIPYLNLICLDLRNLQSTESSPWTNKYKRRNKDKNMDFN